jgi:hypothetical protein
VSYGGKHWASLRQKECLKRVKTPADTTQPTPHCFRFVAESLAANGSLHWRYNAEGSPNMRSVTQAVLLFPTDTGNEALGDEETIMGLFEALLWAAGTRRILQFWIKYSMLPTHLKYQTP